MFITPFRVYLIRAAHAIRVNKLQSVPASCAIIISGAISITGDAREATCATLSLNAHIITEVVHIIAAQILSNAAVSQSVGRSATHTCASSTLAAGDLINARNTHDNTSRAVSSPHFHIDEEARSQPNAHRQRAAALLLILRW